MKKYVLVLLMIALMTIIMSGATMAEGLLPSLTDVYGAELPSMSNSIRRPADLEETVDSGAVTQTFYGVTEEQYSAFGDYLEVQGCTVKGYATEGTAVIVELEKEGSSFAMRYDAANGDTVITYPSGVRLEEYDPYYVGNIVTMGNYGGEAVEWLVLAAEGDTRTMITVKGQDAVCFNKSTWDRNKWENSYIRTWLNDTYYNTAFSAEEQAMIAAGPTGDKVWLLSVDEAKQYFANDDARVCYPTDHAKKNGAYTNDNGAGWWWLRSPGSYSADAADVYSSGGVYTFGSDVSSAGGVARPVVVVALGF